MPSGGRGKWDLYGIEARQVYRVSSRTEELCLQKQNPYKKEIKWSEEVQRRCCTSLCSILFRAYECSAYMCVQAPSVYMVSSEVRRTHWFLWNWNYRE